MGVAAGLLIFTLAGSSQADAAFALRSFGMTCVFGSWFVAERRRKEPGAGASVGELKAILFAGFTALMTLGFIIEYICRHWVR